MDLSMAIRMHQSKVIESVGAAFDAPHDMMCVPVGISSNQLTTDRTAAISIPCKARTLRRLPSCHAFTIRNCRLLTRRWQSDQFVSRHSKVEPERACAAGRSSAQLSVEVSQPFS